MDRRGLLKILGAGGVIGVAGGAGVGVADEHGDENGNDENDDLPSLEEAPEGETLTREEILTLVEIFDDEPTSEGQREIEGEMRNYTPSHVWKWVSDETLIALHFDDPNPEEAEQLNWVVVGQKGLFTEESQPGPEFTHFHQHTADSWEGGHGGEEGDEGYWLTHMGVREFEAPAWDVDVGVDYDFMPTPPDEGSEGHETDWETPNGDDGDLDEADRLALLEVFDDKPMNPDQFEVDGERSRVQDRAQLFYTPSHVWKWVTEDVLMFLHFDEPNPEVADQPIYFGIGSRGQFRADDRPEGPPENGEDGEDDPDFTHFHKWEADSWEGGHGAQDEEQWGYWLVHHAVRPLEMPWGEVDVGVDREFMPTPLPEEDEGDDRDEAEDGEDEEGNEDAEDAIDRTGEDVVEIETREGDGDEPSFVFDPGVVRIDEGTTVRWVNTDGVFHTVTATDSLDRRTPSEEFDATLASEGDTFEWVTEKAGTQHYYCQPHAEFMYGTLDIV